MLPEWAPWTLLNSHGSRPAASLPRHPRPRPGRRPGPLRAPTPGPAQVPRRPPGRCPGSAAVGRLTVPRAPPSRPALRAPPLAARRSAAPAPPVAALQTPQPPPPPPQGAPGLRREPGPGYAGPQGAGLPSGPDGAAGPGVGCRARDGSAGREHAARAPLPRGAGPRGGRPGLWARGRGRGRRARSRPCPRGDRGHPADWPPGIWAGERATASRGAVAPRSARTLRAGPAAVQRGAARLGRSSGAVPAPSGSAPHTCLCPAPGDVAPSDWPAGPRGRGRGR